LRSAPNAAARFLSAFPPRKNARGTEKEAALVFEKDHDGAFSRFLSDG